MMSRGREDILLGRVDENRKILTVLQISGLGGGMKGKFMISRHDGGGGWLLDGWLFADMLLWIPVKRLSCGCVVVNFVPN
jgi:hypothetical protein